MPAQRPWQRIILLTVLGYEELGALVFAMSTRRAPPVVGANRPTPLIGVCEGVNIGVFLVWVVVVVVLLRRNRSRDPSASLDSFPRGGLACPAQR